MRLCPFRCRKTEMLALSEFTVDSPDERPYMMTSPSSRQAILLLLILSPPFLAPPDSDSLVRTLS
jgi:hypothetical protein